MMAQHVAVSLSGGGHRASLFGLGALLYLVDAGKGAEISTISSISGGSLTNGWVGLNTDLTTVTPDEFERQAHTFAHRIARKGTIWSFWMTYALLAVMAAIIAAAIVVTVVGGTLATWIAWIVAVIALGTVAQRRSWVARKSFEHALFGGRPLTDMHDSLDHVICATDLQSSEHVYFSTRFVYSWRTGFGVPAGLHVADAAQASAALPGAFTPVSFPLAPHGFPKSPSYSGFLLTDGGVYDNMGTEWVFRVVDGFDDPGTTRVPSADEVLVVNASAGKSVIKRGKARIPAIGEIVTLLAVKDVLYDQTTAVRRRWLNLRYRIGDRAPDVFPNDLLRGTTIQIDRSPYDLPSTYAKFGDEKGLRARAAIDRLDQSGGSREVWEREADSNKQVGTTLSKIAADRAASLIRHAYVLTMVNAHVLLDYPLIDIPSVERSRSWVS